PPPRPPPSPPPSSPLSILVTGASSGVGHALCSQLAVSDGCRVYLTASTLPQAQEAADLITAAYPAALVTPLALDVLSQPSIDSVAARFASGELHGLVLNAGIGLATSNRNRPARPARRPGRLTKGGAERGEVLHGEKHWDSMSAAERRLHARVLSVERGGLLRWFEHESFSAGVDIVRTNHLGSLAVASALLPKLAPGARVVHAGCGAGPAYAGSEFGEYLKLCRVGGGIQPPDALTTDKPAWDAVMAFVATEGAAGPEGGGWAEDGGAVRAYGMGKLATHAALRIWAREHPRVTFATACPGFVQTRLTAGFGATLPPSAGCRALRDCLLEPLGGSGWWFGSDGKRSPLDRLRRPGEPEFVPAAGAYDGPDVDDPPEAPDYGVLADASGRHKLGVRVANAGGVGNLYDTAKDLSDALASDKAYAARVLAEEEAELLLIEKETVAWKAEEIVIARELAETKAREEREKIEDEKIERAGRDASRAESSRSSARTKARKAGEDEEEAGRRAAEKYLAEQLAGHVAADENAARGAARHAGGDEEEAKEKAREAGELCAREHPLLVAAAARRRRERDARETELREKSRAPGGQEPSEEEAKAEKEHQAEQERLLKEEQLGILRAGNPEAGNPEAGNPEAGNPEAGNPEAGNPEAGNPEAGNPEAGNPEAGEPAPAKSAAARPPSPTSAIILSLLLCVALLANASGFAVAPALSFRPARLFAAPDPPLADLQSFLQLTSAAQTGGEAKVMIQDGEVKLNGEVETRRGKKLFRGDKVKVQGGTGGDLDVGDEVDRSGYVMKVKEKGKGAGGG
ncbi:hypothetical protein TeGR_g12326, partial [Tetraparma gracilis]